MRSKEERLRRLLCAEHCRLFKPWATGVDLCGAYEWLLESAREGDRLLDRLERLRGSHLSVVTEADDPALRLICRRCQHLDHNCGFRTKDRPPKPQPCGGLLVLKALLDEGSVTFEDLHRSLPGNGRPRS